MADGGSKGIALGSVALGALLLFAGITGKDILSAVQALIQGKSPSTAAQTSPINTSTVTATGTSGTGTAAGTATGSALANYAEQYVGAGYVYGGTPAGGTGDWDCSSFVNWCASQVGLPIPGYAAGAYTGTVHGPVVSQWLTWSGLTTVASPQAGDIVCFGLDTHMGIMISATQMVSAENAQDGTQISGTAGFGSPITYRRYPAANPAPVMTPGAGPD